MSNVHFPTALRPVVSKGYSYQRGGNVFRSEVTGGLPRQGRDTYFDTVPFNVTLVTSALGNQAFQSFLNQISGGADSFVMALDSGLGVKDHQCQINSDINFDTSDGVNWTISFSILAERTDIQEDTCLTANLPDLFGCYGDGLNCFLAAYATAQTTFPRVWGPNVIAQFDAVGRDFVGIGFSRNSDATYVDELGALQTAADDIPRYEVDGLLIELASENYINDTNNARFSKSANTTLSRDGEWYVAQKTTAGAGPSYLYLDMTVLNGVVPVSPAVTTSCLVRLDPSFQTSGTFSFNCRLDGSTTYQTALFDIATGMTPTSKTSGVISSASAILGGGVYLVSMTLPCTQSATSNRTFYCSVSGAASVDASGAYVYSLGRLQVEPAPIPSSFIPTSGAAAQRAADVLTLQVQGAKRVYREYTPPGGSTPVTETVPYTGELCPPGHVRVIKVLND